MDVKSYVQAARLRTLPLSVSGIIIGSFMSASKGFFNWKICLLALLTTIGFQIISNFANDYGDGVKGTDNEDRIGPERAVQSGAISPKQMRNAIITSSIITFLIAILLIFIAFGKDDFLNLIIFFCLGIASIAAAIKYTVGKKAYGYSGFGDLFVFLFFGLVSVIGSYYLYSKQLSITLILPAFSVGLLSIGVLNLNNMRDYHNDKSNNKVTLVVKIGVKRAKNYHFFLIGLAVSSFSILLAYTSLIYILGAIPLFVLIKHLIMVKNESNLRNLDGQLKIVALTCFSSSLTYFIISLSNSFFS